MYKVFFKDNVFLLTDDRSMLQQGTLTLIYKDFSGMQAFVRHCLGLKRTFTAAICHQDPESLLATFTSCFLYVKAAGGLVRENGRLLFIKRQGMYDLPKGHLEAGETIEQCAAREVEEETGLKQIRITAPLTATFHIYFRNGNWHLKKTYWYAMSCPSGQTPVPQTEEGIEQVFWLSLSRLDSIKSQTYPSVWEVLSRIR